MKKFLLIVTAVLLIMTAAFAQQKRVAPEGTPKPDAYQNFLEMAKQAPTPSNRAIIFQESFESTSGTPVWDPPYAPPLPSNWTVSTPNKWGTASNGLDIQQCFSVSVPPKAGSRMMYNPYNHCGDNWAFSPGFTLAAGTTYTVSFWWMGMGWLSYNEPDHFEVKIGMSNTPTGMASATTVFTHPGIIYNFDYIWRFATYNFTPTTSGTYYLGFHDLRPLLPYYEYGHCILIDDIKVEDGAPSSDVTITTQVNPAGAGTAAGGGTKPSGSSFTLSATPNPGYSFVNWTSGSTVLSSANPYTFNASASATITANFTQGGALCYREFSYTGAVQSITLDPGTYELEVWGANGGDAAGGTGGKGGYSKGTITVTTPTTYYIYVGGKGITKSNTTVSTTCDGGWNGGGCMYGTHLAGSNGGTGGGGTDIRTTQNTTYADRIIVGGGGGGATGYTTWTGNGGGGGGLTGGTGTSSRGPTYCGQGGTQTAGGAFASASLTNYCTSGAFGVGGNYTATGTLGGNAGGGGWYGGGASSWGGGAGAGSGYIGGVTGGITAQQGETGFVANPDASGNGFVKITSPVFCGGTGPVSCDDVIVGTGTTTQFGVLPGWYGWQREIQLYEAGELGSAGDITKIAFDVTSVVSGTNQRPMKIYLMHTPNAALDAQYVWNTIKAQATLVYDQSTGFTANSWNTFEVTPFAYNGVDNLLVLVEGQGCTLTGGCSAQSRYTNKTNCQWHLRSDNSPPNDGGLAGTRNNQRPNITFEICSSVAGDCNPPTDLEVAYINCETAELSWTAATGGGGIGKTITTPVSNNGSGAIAFNMIAGAQAVTITGIETEFSATGNHNVHLYYRTGTACGFAQNPSGWTLIGVVPVNVTAVNPTRFPVPFPTSVTIPAGQTYGFYFAVCNGANGIRYHDGGSTCAATDVTGSNADLTIKGGTAVVNPSAPFGGSSAFSERKFSGVIHYTLGTGGGGGGVDGYNVYLNGKKINSTPVTGTAYSYSNLDFDLAHTWGVKSICSAGGESEMIEKSKHPCGTCPAPSNLTVDFALGCGTATLNWEAPVGKNAGKAQTETTKHEITDHPVAAKVTMSEQPVMSEFYDNGDTRSCNPLTLPHFEGFETYGGNWPQCWTRLNAIWGNSYPCIYAGYQNSGSYSLWMASEYLPQYVATPAIADNIKGVTIKFALMREHSNSGSFTVGVMSDPNNAATFEAVQVINVTSGYMSYAFHEVSFANATLSGPNRHIAFKMEPTSAYSYWIDDIEITSDGSGTVAYNIYRNGHLLKEKHPTTTYVDDNFLATKAHEWAVEVACVEGGASDRIFAAMEACSISQDGDCNPAQNLVAEYTPDCMTALLTWDEPIGKKKSGSAIYTPSSFKANVDMNAEGSTVRRNKMEVENIQILTSATREKLERPAGGNPERNAITIPKEDGRAPNTVAYGADLYYGDFLKIPLNNPYNYSYFSGYPGIYNDFLTGGDWVDGTWCAVGQGSSDVIRIYKINPANGNYTTITPSIPGYQPYTTLAFGFAYNNAENMGYIVASNGVGQPNNFYKVNLSTGATQQAFTVSGGNTIYDFAFTNDGKLIAISCNNSSQQSQLVEINTSTGATTVLVTAPFFAWYEQAFSNDREDDVMYWLFENMLSGGFYMYKFNYATKQLTYVSGMPSAFYWGITALAIPTDAPMNNNLAKAPTNVTLTPEGGKLKGQLAWTNPTQTLGGANLTGITKMVVERNGAWYADVSPAPAGGNMTLPVNVTSSGSHEFSVYAVTSEGNGKKASTSATFGKSCLVEVDIYHVTYGDGFGWQLTDDETGDILLSGGRTFTSCSYLGDVVLGLYTASVTGNTTFKLFQNNGVCNNYNDNGVGIEVRINGEVKYAYYKAGYSDGIPVGYSESTSLECSGSEYYVYRDGVHIATTIDPVYEDNKYESSTGHLWEVRVKCKEGGLSEPISAYLEACGNTGTCNPPTDLIVEYGEDCKYAELTWTGPETKKSGSSSIAPPANAHASGGSTVRRDGVGEKFEFNTAMRAPRNESSIKSSGVGAITIPGRGPSTVAYGIDCYPGNNQPVTLPLNNPGGLNYLSSSGLPGLPTGGDWVNGEWIVFNVQNNNIYKVNPANGSYTVVATHTVPDPVLGMAYNDADGFAYVSTDYSLWKVNINTGAATHVCYTPKFLYAFAITCNGKFIGFTSDSNAATTEIIEVNPATGTPTTLASVPFFAWYVQDLAVDREDGMIYWAAMEVDPWWGFALSSRLLKFDPTNNQLTIIGAIANMAEVVGFAIPGSCNPNLPKAPTNVTLTPNGKQLNGTFEWTNPTQTVGGAPLTGIQKVVIERNGQFYSESNTNTGLGQTYSIPVNVTSAGEHSFSVYAVNSEGNGGRGSASAVFGDVCEVEVNISYVFEGDEVSWKVTDESGNMIMGGGLQASGSYVSAGTFKAYIAGDATFTIWGHNNIYYYDNAISLTLKLNGDLVYSTNYQIFGPGQSHNEELECGSNMLYNVYRDGGYVATVKGNTYKDVTYNPEESHLWAVKRICEDGGESEPAYAEKEYCWVNCGPVLNLTGEYTFDCEMVLTWESPEWKSRGNVPATADPDFEYITPTQEDIEKDMNKNKQALAITNPSGETIQEATIVKARGCTDVFSPIGTTTGNNLPIQTYWNYSYTQQIFDASIIGDPGIITEIAFQYIKTTPIVNTNQRIFIGHTTKNTFASTSDFVPLSELSEVFYNATITYNNANAWFTIVLDVPFVYTGGNIVLAYLNNRGSQDGSASTFNLHTTTGNKSITFYHDSGGPINPATPTSAILNSIVAQRSNTKFVVCAAVPAGGYNIYRDGELIAANVMENTYTDTDFDPTMPYTWCVKAICESGGESHSACIEMDKCACDINTVSNLEGEYNKDCSINLTWDKPAGKKKSGSSTTQPILVAPDYTNLELDAQKEERLTELVNTKMMRTNPNQANYSTTQEFVDADGFRGDTSPMIYSTASTSTSAVHKTTVGGWNQTGTQLSSISVSYQAMIHVNGEIGVVTYGGGANTYGKLNPNTGAFTLINSNNSQVPDAISMAQHPNGDIYVTEWDDYGVGGRFGKINFATGVFTQVGTLPADGQYYIAIDIDGTCYAIKVNTTACAFGKLNLTNGQFTQTSTFGDGNYIQDLEIDKETGILYHAYRANSSSNTQWVTINKTTGARTTLGTIPSSRVIESVVIMSEAGTPCDAVPNVTATVVNQNNVNLTWTAAPNNPTNYQVLFNGVVISTQTTTSYTHVNVPAGSHSYCVKATYQGDCIPVSVCASVTVQEYFGNCIGKIVGTGTTAQYEVPVNTYWRHSYVQSIYDASEIGDPGVITNIAFNYIRTAPLTKTNQFIYLGHTTKSTFSGTSDWVPLTDLTLVKAATITYDNDNTWLNIEFDTPFEYEGGNLVVAVLNNHGTYVNSDNTFLSHTTTGNKSIHYRVDGTTIINPASPPTASGTLNKRANTRFVVCPSALYNVYCDGELVNEEPLTQNFYTHSGFDYTEAHTWCIKVVCEDGSESLPVCITKDPCIPCQPVENLTAAYNAECCAMIAWEAPLFKKTAPVIIPQENVPVVNRIEKYHTGETVATDRLPAAYAKHYTPVAPLSGYRNFADAYILDTYQTGGYYSLIMETGARTLVGSKPTFLTEETPTGEDFDGTNMYRITNFGRVFSVSETGQTLIGTIPGAIPNVSNTIGLCWDWVNKDGFYYYSYSGSNPYTFTLCKLTIPSLTKTVIGAAPASADVRRGLALHADGFLYSITTALSGTSNLVRINPANGQPTNVGSIGFPAMYGFDMVYDRIEDVLYACPIDYNLTVSKLIKLNTTTGASTLIYNYGLLQHATMSTTKGGGSANFGYNIYRDGELIEENWPDLTYTDCGDFDIYKPHTWTIAQACAMWDESEPVSVTLGACACYPPQNLTVFYYEECVGAELNWEAPIKPFKSKIEIPVREEQPVRTGAVKPQTETAQSATQRQATGAMVTKPVITPTQLDIPRAPKGMVNVTLAANDVWGDGTGYQLLLDQTATQYGNTIPTTGYMHATCSAPPTLYDVFSHKLPTAAAPNCTSPAVVTGSQTIQIPAGTYDWCITNPDPGFPRIWIASAGGGPETSGRRDNYVFQDGLDYLFTMQYWTSTDNDGVVITTTVAADPGAPGLPTNVVVTPTGTQLKGKVSWTNPTLTFGGQPLTSITKVVILRDGTPVHEITTGCTVGGNMSWTDNSVPGAGDHCYAVYAVNAIGNGASASDCATFGDMCNLKFVMSDDWGDGWGTSGGYITVKVDGVSYGQVTCPNNVVYPQTATAYVLVPSGELTLTWTTGSYDMESYVEVYDPADNLLFVSGLPGYFLDPCAPGIGMCGMAGVFLTEEFSCGAGATLYNIYRDGELIEGDYPLTTYEDMCPDLNPYFPHCWYVRAICTGDETGHEESEPSNEVCLPMCHDPSEWSVWGVVANANGVFIPGAKLNLMEATYGYMEYNTVSVNEGKFDFPAVWKAKYDLTVDAICLGYQLKEQPVVVKGHTNLGTITLLEIPYPPTNVKATDETTYAHITWNLPDTVPMTLKGYKIYRLLEGQEENPELWVTLTSNPVPEMFYKDYSWAKAGYGKYVWAVRTCYAGGVISEPAFSDTIFHNIEVKYTIKVTTNTGDSPMGAEVTLTNKDYTYRQIAPSDGNVVFATVWCGEYKLTVTLNGYKDHITDKLVIMEPGTTEVELIESITPPFDVEVDIECNVATVTWSHAADNVTGFTVYLNDAEGIKTQKLEHVFTQLAIGDYSVCIEANYRTGKSECVESTFKITCTGINTIEDGDFILYPIPATNILNVERGNNERAIIEIYNPMGMFINRYETIESKFEIDVTDLAAGTYFIKLTEGDKTGVKGFVKK